MEFLAALTNSLEKFEYELAIKSLNKGLVVLIGLFALWAGAGLWGLIIIMTLAQGFSLLLNGGIIWKRITPLSLRMDSLSGGTSFASPGLSVYPFSL